MTFLFKPMWPKQLSTVLLLAILACAIWPARQASAAHEHQDRSVIGKWKLTSVLDFAAVSALDEEEARQFIGKVLTIDRDKVQLGSRVCSSSKFRAERVAPERDLREKAHASAAKLGLPNPVTVVELSCAYVYIKNRNHLILAWDGAFFGAVRMRP